MFDTSYCTYCVEPQHDRMRLDQFLKHMQPDESRTRIQNNIKSGHVQVNDIPISIPKFTVSPGQTVLYKTLEQPDSIQWQPQTMPLNILFEDEYLCVINKPAGLIMHPGAGVPDKTLANALLAHDIDRAQLDRAGLIHRLDKNTSGCCITARTRPAQQHLVQALEAREIKRTYLALVQGIIELPGKISAPIGRHPRRRTAMTVLSSGRHALTHYQPIAHYPKHTLLELQLDTGRTHQIRVHMKHLGHPIVGDSLYGHTHMPSKSYPETARKYLSQYPYQALHAMQIEFTHPITAQPMKFKAPLPDVFKILIQSLEPVKRDTLH